MRGRNVINDTIGPMILNILKESKNSMSVLGINYRINEIVGRAVHRNVIRNHLVFLVKKNKISEILDKENGIMHYKLNL